MISCCYVGPAKCYFTLTNLSRRQTMCHDLKNNFDGQWSKYLLGKYFLGKVPTDRFVD